MLAAPLLIISNKIRKASYTKVIFNGKPKFKEFFFAITVTTQITEYTESIFLIHVIFY